jgi:SH3-like domain-containing protein
MVLRFNPFILGAVFAALLSVSAPVRAATDTPPPAAEAPQQAQNFRDTTLPLPRFVSLRSDKVYMREGPALRYPIKWVYERPRMPVEIIQEFENWRKIRDFDGEEGWIHESMLSGERTAMVKSDAVVPLREDADEKSRMVVRAQPKVIAGIDKCKGLWCRVDVGGYKGWIQRNFLWGIYPGEEIN